MNLIYTHLILGALICVIGWPIYVGAIIVRQYNKPMWRSWVEKV